MKKIVVINKAKLTIERNKKIVSEWIDGSVEVKTVLLIGFSFLLLLVIVLSFQLIVQVHAVIIRIQLSGSLRHDVWSPYPFQHF